MIILTAHAIISLNSYLHKSLIMYATGCTQDGNMPYLHDETQAPTAPRVTIQTENTISITSTTQTHNILKHSKAKNTNGRYTTNIPTDPHTVTTTDIKTNMRHIYIYLSSLGI